MSEVNFNKLISEMAEKHISQEDIIDELLRKLTLLAVDVAVDSEKEDDFLTVRDSVKEAMNNAPGHYGDYYHWASTLWHLDQGWFFDCLDFRDEFLEAGYDE